MNISTRLWMNYILLFTLLLFMGISAMISFDELSIAIETILKENYRSNVAAHQMIEALEREDSACLAFLTGKIELQQVALEEGKRSFAQAFPVAQSNITLAEEETLLEKINDLYQRYSSTLLHLQVGEWEAYQKQLLPLFHELKKYLLQMIHINQEAMFKADYKAKTLAFYSSTGMALLTGMGLFLSILLAKMMKFSMIDPLHSVLQEAQRIAHGNLTQRISFKKKNEIGALATLINLLTEQLEQYQETQAEHLLETRQFAYALLNLFPHPACILDGTSKISYLNRQAEPLFIEEQGQNFQKLLQARLTLKTEETSLGQITHPHGKVYHLRRQLLQRANQRELGYLLFFEPLLKSEVAL
jgi:NtrC-family two-component system sensor histidine kinase KinB